jgi:beta-phosphoglucomutase-like phosphatase (HAD superfamily)
MLNLSKLPGDIGGLIFDCDGTLVNTPPVYARAWAAGLRLSGREITPEWYFARSGMSEHVLMDQFEAEFGIQLQREEVVRVMRTAFIEELGRLEEITAITAVARQNHGRLPMAVASGGSRAIVTATLDVTGLKSLFGVVVTIDDVGRAKPEPDLFLEAARRIGVPPARCLVFEDSREGLEAAHRAGMRTVDVLEVLRQL